MVTDFGENNKRPATASVSHPRWWTSILKPATGTVGRWPKCRTAEHTVVIIPKAKLRIIIDQCLYFHPAQRISKSRHSLSTVWALLQVHNPGNRSERIRAPEHPGYTRSMARVWPTALLSAGVGAYAVNNAQSTGMLDVVRGFAGRLGLPSAAPPAPPGTSSGGEGVRMSIPSCPLDSVLVVEQRW